MLTSNLNAEVILIIVKVNISMSVINIQVTIYRDYEHHVSHYKAWMARQKILGRLFGIHEESFQILLAFK
jgi:hypothetical protein